MSALVEIAKMGPKIVAAGAKELAELAGKTDNAAALAAKVAPTPPKSVRAARARAGAEGVTSGPGPAPVKRATRTRKPAASAPAPTTGPATPAPVSPPPAGPRKLSRVQAKKQADSLEARMKRVESTRANWQATQQSRAREEVRARVKAQRIKYSTGREQFQTKQYADNLESRMRAKETAEARRKRLQSVAPKVAGGAAVAAGGALAARKALKHVALRKPAQSAGLNPTQKAMVGAGAGASTGMLLHQRSKDR